MKAITNLRRVIISLCASAWLAVTLQVAAEEVQQSQLGNWPLIKANLFDDNREILSDDTISLITPVRAEDAAVVPISVNATMEQSDDLYIQKIYLVVDNNPSPVVGVFTLSRDTGVASLSTRIRVNAYSDVRAIAETSDGKLHMATNFVKASGGCSAPAGSNDEGAINRRGKMKLRQQKRDDLLQLRLLISHPNYSGLQRNQLTQLWIPADYINELRVSLDGREIISFVGGISMSENPAFGFTLKPAKKGKLVATARDSQGREYSQSWPVTAAP